jgi:hypothetical protein
MIPSYSGFINFEEVFELTAELNEVLTKVLHNRGEQAMSAR